MALTRSTAKVVVLPVDHYAGARHTRRAWAAAIAPVGSDEAGERELCSHSHGHQTTEAAVRCGTAMWKQLP